MPRLDEQLKVPICQKVVTLFLRRLNRQKAAYRSGRLSFTICEKNLPEFYDPEYPGAEEELFDELEKLGSLDVIGIEYGRRRTNAPRFDRKTRLVFNAAMEEACRDILDMPSESDRQLWARAVGEAELLDALCDVLKAGKPIAVEGKSYPETAKRIASVAGLLKAGMTCRQISAAIFWGMSKVLDSRPDIVRALHGVDVPVILNVFAASDTFDAVCFVENYDTYASFTQSSSLDEWIFIYSAGFGGSAMRIREKTGCDIHYSSQDRLSADARQRFELWLGNDLDEQLPVYFFGDFDFSAMAIFASLKRIFPGIRPDAKRYAFMLEQVRKGSGHAPAMAGKEKQADPKTVGESYCDEVLLPAMRAHGFYDQEGVPLD
jgi:hypothetical protein